MITNQVRDKALDLAIECIEAIKDVFGSNGDVMDGFKTRCRHEIANLYYNGITYTLSFILSKSSDKGMTGFEKLNHALSNDPLRDIFKKVSGNVSKEAYELYGICLVRALKELGVITKANNVIDVLGQLNDVNAEVLADDKLLMFAEWLKRLAEATIRSRG
ncbi:type III-B CRISPR module-associated protein Cmr5 [Vulcanisaeta distributa]|uniref:type III-B CRISPR module-associated protein Cmr5 n=1 Tax=Vulcanisaeta distributa TaxID=164451 RepID=UPI0006D12A48|nr:type III-B CRISPR module-associated protein Cmr5 [Vulcanisaeta distributa]